MQALHLMYGLGALAAPLIAQPFLVETSDVDTLKPNDNNAEVFHPEKVRLIVPYFIVATQMMCNAVIFFLLWRAHPETEPHPSRTQPVKVDLRLPESTSNDDRKNDARSCAPESTITCTAIDQSDRKYKGIVCVLVILFMHIYYGLEITFGSFLMTFAVKSKLRLTKADGAHLSSLFWSTFTFLRLFTVFYIEWVGAELNIFVCLVVILIANGILVPYGNKDVSMLWTGVAMIGLGTSSIWSCMFGYLEEYFPVTNMIAAGMIVAAIVGEFVFPVVISTVVDEMPEILLWVTLFCSVMISILFTLIVIVCRLKLKKPQNRNLYSAE